MRLDLDVRRTWRCPACGAERRLPGDRTAIRCTECDEGPLMTLIDRWRTPRPIPDRPDLTMELHPDDVDAPAYVPAHLVEDAPAAQEAESPSVPEPPASEEQKPARSGKRQSRHRSRRKSPGAEPPAESASASAAAPPKTSAESTPPPPSPSPPPDTFGDGVLDGS